MTISKSGRNKNSKKPQDKNKIHSEIHHLQCKNGLNLPLWRKKPYSSHCDDYRMISLMSHVLKVFLRTHIRFQSGEALFSLNVLTQICMHMNIAVYACLIDYRKESRIRKC